MIRPYHLAIAILLPLAAAVAVAGLAQPAMDYEQPGDVQQALAYAQSQGEAARKRAESLEAEAASATEAAERTAHEAAGAAARIQQAEAAIAEDQARIGLVEQQRAALHTRLAEKRRPLIGLTASLQRLARRPPVLSMLRPGSLRDAVYLRAILASMLPEVERRTASLRAEIARSKALQEQARLAVVKLQAGEAEWRQRRQNLAALETRQRLAVRAVSGVADREAERALALAERTRDLDGLASDLGKAGALRAELAALPGPVLRPVQPLAAQVGAETPATPSAQAGPPAYAWPASGRLVAGFGESPQGLPRSRGIALAVRQGSQAVAPAGGRVAFAGPYRGYGSIVIIEHDGGWTSLITGLAQLDARVGDRLVRGSPLGIAGAGRPIITLELRRDGVPVNPLEYIKSL
ncbi:MAG: peptidoglycan DD-metalloendopeptidase family protein [Novosphingobium sp.]